MARVATGSTAEISAPKSSDGSASSLLTDIRDSFCNGVSEKAYYKR